MRGYRWKDLPIKFRGKDVDTDKYVYGDLVHGDDGFVFINNKNIYRVYPESVSQLVGYDANGEEVYTDDIVVDEQYKDRLFLPRQYADKTVVCVETSSLRSDYSGSAFVPLQTRISHKPPYESINVKVYLYKGELVDDCEVI